MSEASVSRERIRPTLHRFGFAVANGEATVD
jgi:hypothetical protein